MFAPTQERTGGRGKSVGRSSRDGAPRELALPILELRVGDAAVEPAALPFGIVGVLDAQRRQRRGKTLAVGLVQGREVPVERRAGVAVGRDVMHVQHQDVLLIVQTNDRRTHDGTVDEVEAEAGLLAQDPLRLRLSLVGEHPLQIDEVDLERLALADDLHRTVADDGVGGAQDRVALEQAVQRLAQQLEVERARSAGTLLASCRRCRRRRPG